MAIPNEEFAYIVFEQIDEPVIAAIDALLSQFLTIHEAALWRTMPFGESDPHKYRCLQSTGGNLDFRRDITRLATMVQDYLTAHKHDS